jgi:hypothetical protein
MVIVVAAIANLLCYLLTFLFIYKLGCHLDGPSLGWAMACASLPIPVVFRKSFLLRFSTGRRT